MSAETPAVLNFDPVADEYDQTRVLPPDVQEQAARMIREAIALTPGQVLLDAGVGTGRFALPLARQGVPVLGIDISRGMMGRLQAKRAALEQGGRIVPLRLARGDLRRLPVASGVIGAALMVHILHLIVDWRAVVDEIHRVLAPGGVLILASESGTRRWLPTRDFYFERAKQRGVLRAHQGATGEEVYAYLAETGAQAARVDAERIQWTMPVRVADTLEMLRRRTWSSLWAISDADHAELMAATETWARQTYGSLDADEESSAMLQVWAARWN
jgi:ubiquinone/menaquinone biosynthesis C-methylase UbiE